MNPKITDTLTVRSSHPGMADSTAVSPRNYVGLDAEPGPVVNLIAVATISGLLWDLLVDPRAAALVPQQITPGTAFTFAIGTDVPWLHRMEVRSAKTANMW